MIENEYVRDVELALNNLPAPSKLRARRPVTSLMTEDNRQAFIALGDLSDGEPPLADYRPRVQSPMESQPSSVSAAVTQSVEPDMEMTETTTTRIDANQLKIPW